MIKTYKHNTMEFQKLDTFCNIANSMLHGTKYMLYLDDIYFDCGQNWMYTAILTHDINSDNEWQSLCPRDYKGLLMTDSFSEIANKAMFYAKELCDGKICIDLFK